MSRALELGRKIRQESVQKSQILSQDGGIHNGRDETEDALLLEYGRHCGLVSTTRWVATSGPRDAIGGTTSGVDSQPDNHGVEIVRKQIVQAHGKDIIKKGSLRKGRVLVVFGDEIRPKKGGTLGVLKNLDTKHPCMDMDFPEGVLRFHGTMVFPKNKYVSLKLGNKEVFCEDIFESVILFSKIEWINGGKDTGTILNGDDIATTLPKSLIERLTHGQQDCDLAHGGIDMIATQTSQTIPPPNKRARRPRDVISEEDLGNTVEDVSQPASDSTTRRRSSGRITGNKKPKYNIDDDADEDNENEEEDQLEEEYSQDEELEIDLCSSSSEDDGDS